VKKLLVILTAAAGLCGSMVWLPIACGQSGGTPARSASASRIACLDLAEVLRQYKKSDDLVKDAKAQVDAENARMQQLLGEGQEMEKSLIDGTLDKESAEYAEREKKVIQLSARVKTLKSAKEKELKTAQAKALLSIYKDVAAVTQQVAEQNGYTLVLRIDREAEAAASYQTIARTLSESVLRHDPRNDITDVVIALLNRQYDESGAGSAAADAGKGTSAAKTSPREGPNGPSRRGAAR
jgi:Skp family chaperone for outer membrane proteins